MVVVVVVGDSDSGRGGELDGKRRKIQTAWRSRPIARLLVAWRYTIFGGYALSQKTISLCRMSFALQKKAFLRIVARRSPKVGFRFNFTYVHPRQAQTPRTQSTAQRDTRRRCRLYPIQFSILPNSQFHINLVLIVLPYRLGNLQDTSLDSIGSRRRRSPALLGTRHPETRGRRRRRRKKIVSTQRRHQT